MRILWNARDWTAAMADLPADGRVPRTPRSAPSRPPPFLSGRTVLVPRARVAHVLRRELVRARRPDLLAGTRFIRPEDLALETLHDAAVAFAPGEDDFRPARVAVLLGATPAPELEYFAITLLRSTPGWDRAFARTIADLEGAGLRPDDLPTDDARFRDVATI